jgi:hypothetical protein
MLNYALFRLFIHLISFERNFDNIIKIEQFYKMMR